MHLISLNFALNVAPDDVLSETMTACRMNTNCKTLLKPKEMNGFIHHNL